MRRGAFLRDNAFLVAAVCLPVLVAGLFMLASAIPRSTVPPPAYDLVFKVALPYQVRTTAGVVVDFEVRDERVRVSVGSRVPAGSYEPSWALLIYDHDTMTVREVQYDPPVTSSASDSPRIIVLPSLADKRVSSESRALDGYELQNRASWNRGLVGELFGFGGGRRAPALVNSGRTVRLTLPARFTDTYQPPVYALGWIVDNGAR